MFHGTGSLKGDEWILFQVNEGPCSAGCDYCYERPVALNLLNDAQAKGKLPATDLNQLNNRDLAGFISQNNQTLGLEMSVEELSHYFSILREAGISRAGLIGSEPTSHSRFEEILDAAQAQEIDLLVYTAGMSPEKLVHPVIKQIVLHLDYGRLGEEQMKKKIDEETLPPDAYMEKINRLIDQGKLIDLRINFTSAGLPEKGLVFNFYKKLSPENRSKVLFKYSFSTRVHEDPTSDYFTPQSLNHASPRLMSFVDEFKKQFPESPMYSERPLFPCSFSKDEWQAYTDKGGFVSRCYMEYTVYPNSGLALCPPSRSLEAGKQIKNPAQLIDRLNELREKIDTVLQLPSFPECEPCEHRADMTCQGGCYGYKIGLLEKTGQLQQRSQQLGQIELLVPN